jgi:hypothetical protein
MEVSTDTPFAFFVDIWWYSFTFHFVMFFVFWMTKAGRWTDLIGRA